MAELTAPLTDVPPPSEDCPLYCKVRHAKPRSSNLFLITWNEGWRSGILATGLYESDADWLLKLLGRRPRGR